MIKGNLDLLACNRAEGWACDTNDFAAKLSVHVLYDGREILRGMADRKRSDLGKIHESQNFAFFLNFDAVADVRKISVIVRTPQGEELTLPARGKVIDKSRGYQSFDNQQGDSDSFAKLKALRLPPRYDGLSVLDIGCNEGFFCLDALKRGASRVVGIDANAEIIRKARARTDKVEYIHGSWWQIPEEKFDIIYFLSAIHYEPRQKALLDMLSEHLTDSGKLILECGIFKESNKKQWFSIQRHDGYIKFPTFSLLLENLLNKYCVTTMGSSIMQSGDPVPRFVFHCSRKKPIVIFIPGESGIGKTYLAARIGTAENFATLSLDSYFHIVTQSPLFTDDKRKLYKKIKETCNINKIDKFILSLDENEYAELSEIFFNMLPLEMDGIVIEGYPLLIPQIRDHLYNRLTERGVHVWTLSKEDIK